MEIKLSENFTTIGVVSGKFLDIGELIFDVLKLILMSFVFVLSFLMFQKVFLKKM